MEKWGLVRLLSALVFFRAAVRVSLDENGEKDRFRQHFGLYRVFAFPPVLVNDLYVNIPIAYVSAWLVGMIYKPTFIPALVASYWITNVLGFVLMHRGICRIGRKECAGGPYTRKDLLNDLMLSLAYTGLILLLVHLNVIDTLGDHFRSRWSS